MSKTAPAVERAALVLSLLAARPADDLSLSELARRLDLSKASCHALLASLTATGFVLRHPTRQTFRLGPALIGLGRAAEEGFGAIDFARGQMRELAARLQLECFATAVAGEEIVVLDRARVHAPLSVSVRVGQRFPLAPPHGTVFLAWSPAEMIDGWLGPDLTTLQLQRYREALAAVRRRGYAVRLTAEPDDEAGPDDRVLLELGGTDALRIHFVAAPVFGPDGSVAMALTLIGLPDQLTAGDLPSLAAELCQAAAHVTEAIHGRAPTGNR